MKDVNHQPDASRWSAMSLGSGVLNRRMLVCIFTGLASGMPLYLLIQLVPAWLRDSGVSLAEIGLFALVGLPYTCLLYTSPSPRDMRRSRMPSSA